MKVRLLQGKVYFNWVVVRMSAAIRGGASGLRTSSPVALIQVAPPRDDQDEGEPSETVG